MRHQRTVLERIHRANTVDKAKALVARLNKEHVPYMLMVMAIENRDRLASSEEARDAVDERLFLHTKSARAVENWIAQEYEDC